MTPPQLSAHFAHRHPSAIRLAQIEFARRQDDTAAVNVAIGNVGLPMHPAMQARLRAMGGDGKPFADGVVSYSATVGLPEANAALLNIIASSGGAVDRLHSQVTDGGSQGMELVLVGCCGPAGSGERPLLLIDAAYANYKAFAARVGRRTVSLARHLEIDGTFALPSTGEISALIAREQPGALVVIPYDNPTGQLYTREMLVDLARLCVAHNMWLISDEAYRELYYRDVDPVSIWSLTEAEVPGLTGRRISLETASKVWNACGLRIGGLVTDNADFHVRAVAENTASLCSNVLGQHIFGALAAVPHVELRGWYRQQRRYYQDMSTTLVGGVQAQLPGAIVSRPEASIYSVVDLRQIVPSGFRALDFVLFCARDGRLAVGDEHLTLLTAPMSGFYQVAAGTANPGDTQLRIAYVASPKRMAQVPELLAGLLAQYLA